ncbi:MAG: amidohydrolase [Firmicutes bacterium]|nr:amidohydrolase [Bacillota bacterium]
MTDYKREAEAMASEIIENRRTVHGFAELGLETVKTAAFVEEKLKSYGIEPVRCGKNGVSAVIGQGGSVLLLRADMDALPMKEQSGLPFASQGDACHSCGHDMHTAMLLAAAKLLKAHESELAGRVKLMFQPGEELLAGAAEMIAAGIMEEPHVDAAVAIHVAAGTPHAVPGLISFKRDYSTFSGDFVKVTVIGKQAHGSTPELGVDAINIAAHIVTGLEELISREVSNTERSVVLVGKIYGGDSCNTQSGICVLETSVRAASAERRAFLKQRVREISEGIAAAFRGRAEVENVYGMPPLYNHPDMCACVPGYAAELLGRENVNELRDFTGTEDFTAVAELVPSIYLHLGAGSQAGEGVTLHSPNILFDESVMPTGAAVYAHVAARYLEEHQK